MYIIFQLLRSKTLEDVLDLFGITYQNSLDERHIKTLIEGTKALVSIPVPKEWNATEDELLGISVENEQVKEIKGTLSEDGIYSFEVDHFSAKGVAYNAKAVAEEAVYSGTGNLVGGNVYTLDTAFTRRWSKERIPNDFKNDEIQKLNVPGMKEYT